MSYGDHGNLTQDMLKRKLARKLAINFQQGIEEAVAKKCTVDPASGRMVRGQLSKKLCQRCQEPFFDAGTGCPTCGSAAINRMIDAEEEALS